MVKKAAAIPSSLWREEQIVGIVSDRLNLSQIRKLISLTVALMIGLSLCGSKIFARESAEDLLRNSEVALSKANNFSVEYSTELRTSEDQLWLALQGKLSFEGDNHYFGERKPTY